MKGVAGDASRVLIYCPLVQRLINAKMPAAMIQQYPDVTPVIVALPPAASDAPVWLPPGVNAADLDDDNAPYDDVPERVLKKQNVILKALKKMNCFAIEKRKSEYKAYHRQKTIESSLNLLMQNSGIPYPEPSAELTESAFMAQNEYSYWFGDDASSLAPYWHGDPGQSSSNPAPGAGAAEDSGDEDADDDEDDDYEDE